MKKHHFKIGALMSLIVILSILAVKLFIPTVVPVEPTKKQNLDLSLVQNDFYIDEANYEDSMQQIVVPYLSQYEHSNYFTTSDNAKIYYKQYLLEQPKGHIAISHGFTESSQKYDEVIYYFLMEGYNVSILEHRNHGYSDRMVDDPSKVHIEDFNTYVEDFKTFMDTVVMPTVTDEPCYLYAHSMGGAIGARFLETSPEYFDAAVLSAPMLEIETGGIPIPLAKFISKAATLTGFGKSYVLGHGPFEETYNFENASTSSETRYKYIYNKKINDPMIRTNGATFNWLSASLKGSELASKNSDKINIPVLLFQSGHDTLVKPNGQNTFVNNAPQATLIYVADAKHELYCEVQEIMVPYFNTIFNFFNELDS